MRRNYAAGRPCHPGATVGGGDELPKPRSLRTIEGSAGARPTCGAELTFVIAAPTPSVSIAPPAHCGAAYPADGVARIVA
jgi:hypothetical protein